MLVLSKDKKWYRVSFRLTGDSLPVDEIEARLNLAPSNIGRKGEPHNDHPKSYLFRTNLWGWKYSVSSDIPFEEQITGLLDLLDPKVSALKEILSLPDVKGELFLGFGSRNGQGGAIFSCELLSRIAEFGLSLSLDLYPPSIDGEEE